MQLYGWVVLPVAEWADRVSEKQISGALNLEEYLINNHPPPARWRGGGSLLQSMAITEDSLISPSVRWVQ